MAIKRSRIPVQAQVFKAMDRAEILQRITASNDTEIEFGDPRKIWGDLAEEQTDCNIIVAVLTEEGTNNNGHHFYQDVLIAKHATAKGKPTNLGHEQREVIGYIFDTAIANDKNEIISDDDIGVKEDGTPYYKGEGKIRTLVACVLWNMIGRDEVDQIVADVKSGKRVDMSMECFFVAYEILLINDKTGSVETIPGTANNKHYLEKVGRTFAGRKVAQAPLMDNFAFGGIGQVSKGACPESVILAAASSMFDSEVEGESVFTLNEHFLQSFVDSLPDDFKEKFNKLASASKTDVGEDTMEKDEKEKGQGGTPSTPVSDQGISELASTIATQATNIGTLTASLSTATTEKGVAVERVKELEGQMETMKAEHGTALTTSQNEVKQSKLEAKVNGYLYQLAKQNPTLVFDETVVRAAIAVDSFNDDSFKTLVIDLKAAQTKVDEERVKAKASLLRETLGMAPESSDEEVAERQQQIQAAVKSLVETPEAPVQTPKAKAAAAVAGAVASASAADGTGYKPGKMRAVAVNSDTGKEVKTGSDS